MNWLVVNSATAAGLALLVLLLGRLLRPAPTVMHGLWFCVLLKLVTPPLFEVPIDLSWLRDERGTSLAVVVPVELAASAVGQPGLAPTAAASPFAAERSGLRWSELLRFAWLVGSAGFLAMLLLGVWRGHRRLRALGPVPPQLRLEVAALAEQMGVRVPELLDDPAAASPCVWSLGRARLVLPSAVLANSSAKGRAAVLAHELAHLRRGDHLVAHVELLLASVLWWHPLFWLARARLRHWAELACDAWAVASVPDATIDYAAVLIETVARPDSAVPGLTVLAARPAARAAFERRLTMILNENVPCRAPRAWWLPFASLGLGLFTVPVVAQHEAKPEVRIEVRVNGKELSELSGEQRRALLQQLLHEGEAEAKPAKASKKGRHKVDDDDDDAQQQPAASPRPGKVLGKLRKKGQPSDNEATPSAVEIHGMLAEGLAEARAEILGDQDLRELGITDAVVALIDGIGSGKGIDDSNDDIVKAAMKGAGKLVVKEIADDPDLRKMGMADGIGKLVAGFLGNERNQEMLGDFVRRAAKSALQDVKVEIGNDEDLQHLGIAVDVQGLVDGLFSGKGDFQGSLQKVLGKAMQGAMRERADADEDESNEPATKPAAKKKLGRKVRESAAEIR